MKGGRFKDKKLEEEYARKVSEAKRLFIGCVIIPVIIGLITGYIAGLYLA